MTISKAFISAGFAVVAFATMPAKAHIIIENMQGRAGYNELLTLVVPHGCGAGATTELRMKVPPEITLIVPEKAVGWQVELVKKKSENL
ncbi:MAG: DUF1775 domain-containing protein [Rhodospirillaceae bacterium]|nr:DUF1775 domain-containing protein [Rhodospirillaceae bacterium]